jgi:multiple sugar transport system permease protein
MIVLPFWFVLSGSIKAPQEIISRTPTLFPQSFTTQHYEKLLAASDYAAYMLNSIVVAAASTTLTLALAIPAGYAFFRLTFRGRAALYRVILLAYAFPSIVVLVPSSRCLRRIGLVDTRDGAGAGQHRLRAAVRDLDAARFLLADPARDRGGRAHGRGAAAHDPPPHSPAADRARGWRRRRLRLRDQLDGVCLRVRDDPDGCEADGAGGVFRHHRAVPGGLGGCCLAGASLAILPVVLLFAVIGRWFVAGLTEGAVK